MTRSSCPPDDNAVICGPLPLFSFARETASASRCRCPCLQRAYAMKVLVVEDEKKMAAFLERGLKEHGFLVTVTRRGDEAMELILQSALDAVVLDVMLPGLDGLSLLRRLRQRGNTTPVLMLSARGAVDERVEGLEAGADDYLA